MFNKLITTQNDLTGLLLRLPLGTVMLYHGLQKAFGLFGGYGFEGTMQFFTDTVHIPWLVGYFTIVIETLGAVGLIVGFLGRLNAMGTFAVMLGAMITTHVPFGFSMNWFGNQKGEGYEMDLLIFGMSLGLLIIGSGRYSIDRLLTKTANQATDEPTHSARRTSVYETDLGN